MKTKRSIVLLPCLLFLTCCDSDSYEYFKRDFKSYFSYNLDFSNMTMTGGPGLISSFSSSLIGDDSFKDFFEDKISILKYQKSPYSNMLDNGINGHEPIIQSYKTNEEGEINKWVSFYFKEQQMLTSFNTQNKDNSTWYISDIDTNWREEVISQLEIYNPYVR